MKTLAIIRLALAGVVGTSVGHLLRAELTPAEADGFLRDFYGAYNATGASKLAAFYADDATFSDPTFGLNLKGREQIGGLFTTVLAKYESLGHEVSHTIVAGDELVVEGTMVGKLAGKTVRVRFTSVFHFVNRKIATQRDMFDVLHFYAQLGIVPPQFRAKPAAPAAAKTPS